MCLLSMRGGVPVLCDNLVTGNVHTPDDGRELAVISAIHIFVNAGTMTRFVGSFSRQ